MASHDAESAMRGYATLFTTVWVCMGPGTGKQSQAGSGVETVQTVASVCRAGDRPGWKSSPPARRGRGCTAAGSACCKDQAGAGAFRGLGMRARRYHRRPCCCTGEPSPSCGSGAPCDKRSFARKRSRQPAVSAGRTPRNAAAVLRRYEQALRRPYLRRRSRAPDPENNRRVAPRGPAGDVLFGRKGRPTAARRGKK